MLYIGKGSSRQQMNGSHHGADQPFDVAAEVWLPSGTMIEADPILLATPYQSLGVELSGVVDVENLR